MSQENVFFIHQLTAPATRHN